MTGANIEFNPNIFFANAARIQQARKDLGPKNQIFLNYLNKPSLLWKESPYIHERVIFESWLGLTERKLLGNSLNQKDLDSIKSIFGWLDGLTKEQCVASKSRDRNLEPLLLSEQTKGELRTKLQQDFINDPDALDQVIVMMRSLCNQLDSRGLLEHNMINISTAIKSMYEGS